LREAKAQSASPERPAHTPLNDNLKRRWGTGELSSATVQSLAHDAATQGTPGIDNIAASGTYGAHPQNLFRDLLKLFGSPVGAPMIDWIEIPLKSGRKISHPFILPHRFFNRWPMIVLISGDSASSEAQVQRGSFGSRCVKPRL
jgi:hypothetical protein